MLPKSETSDFGCNPSFSQENFDAKKMDHQNSGVPEFWHFKGAQIGNIRFAVVKPAGDAAGRVNTGSIRPGHALARA
jgi:hypothetical protein